jgi:hypothetical protein
MWVEVGQPSSRKFAVPSSHCSALKIKTAGTCAILALSVKLCADRDGGNFMCVLFNALNDLIMCMTLMSQYNGTVGSEISGITWCIVDTVKGKETSRFDKVCGFLISAPICPSSGVQLITSAT